MALTSINEIGSAKPLPPEQESGRVADINRNRLLYRNDQRALGVTALNDDQLPATKVNWFKRIADFYPEFMLADKPDIVVRDNERFTEIVNMFERMIFAQLFDANIDMTRFGQGVITSHPNDPLVPVCFTPDNHFEVCNTLGEVTADVFTIILGEAPSNEKRHNNIKFENRHLHKIVYDYIDGTSKKYIYGYKAGVVGELLNTINLPARAGRQFAEVFSNRGRESLYPDIAPMIGEIGRTMTSMSTSIKRNLRPHLYGPDGSVIVDENGRATIDVKGMFFPLSEGDIPPGYIQWDSKLEAVEYNIATNLEFALNMVGLNTMLFTPGAATGALSGVALQRLFIPFVAKINHYKEANHRAVIDILRMLAANNAAMGSELFVFNDDDVEITWHFEDIFQDESEVTNEPDDQESDSDRVSDDSE